MPQRSFGRLQCCSDRTRRRSGGSSPAPAGTLVDEELNAVTVRVQTKLAQARAALRLLTADGTNELGYALAAAAEIALLEHESDVINVPCPVGGFNGWGDGVVVDEGDAEGETTTAASPGTGCQTLRAARQLRVPSLPPSP